MRKTSTQGELTSTLMPYHGMSPKIQTSTRRRAYLQHFRKPTLSSRISLATSKEPGLRYSTATNQFHNFHSQNGSTSSMDTPSTSTTSSQTSIQSPTMSVKSLSLGRVLNSFTVHPHQQKLFKPMETGSLPGTVWLKPSYLYSSIGNPNCKPMVNTSNVFSHPCLPNSTTESSAMTKLSASGQLNNATLNSQASLNLQTCKFNESATPQLPQLPQLTHQQDL
jgi:hypothetical protein